MINKRIIGSLLSILTTLAMMTGATFAFFTDTAISQNNTFSTGNADLQIAQDNAGQPASYGEEIPAPAINETDIFPNFTKQYVFWLKNNSSSAIKLDITTTFDDVVTTGNADISNQLNSQFTCVTDLDNNGTFDNPLATTGTQSINAWDANSIGMGQLNVKDGDSNSGADEAKCTMTITLNDVNNTYAGSSVRFDGVFIGTQAP